MGVTREDLRVGGRCYLRIMQHAAGGAGAMRYRAAMVEAVERAAAVIRTLDDGKRRTVRFCDLSPDEEYLAEQNAADRQKYARLRREAEEPALKLVREEPPPQPLTQSLGDKLRAATPPPTPEPAPAPRKPPPAPPAEPAPAPAQPPPQPPAEPAPAPAPPPPSDGSQLQAWLEMGREVLGPIERELARLREERAQLSARQSELAEAHNKNVSATERALAQYQTLRQVLAGVDPEHAPPALTPEQLPAPVANVAALEEELAAWRERGQAIEAWAEEREGTRWQGASIKRHIKALLAGKRVADPEQGRLTGSW